MKIEILLKKILLISILIICLGSISYGASFTMNNVRESFEYLQTNGYLQNFNLNYLSSANNYINNSAWKSYGIVVAKNYVWLVTSWNNVINNQSNCGRFSLSGSSFSGNLNWGTVAFDDVELAYSPYGISILGVPANEIYDKFAPTFEFVPNYDYVVHYGDYVDTFNLLKRGYSNSSWALGTFTDIPEEVNKIRVVMIFDDTSYEDRFYIPTYKFLNDYFFIYNNQFYVHSRYMKYNTPYFLLFYLYDSNDDFIESYQYNYLFLPYNANVENGVIVSAGSGDYNVQDSTNDTIGVITDDSEIDSILDETFSGDIESFASDFGFTAFDNPFSTFLLHIVDSLYDALTVRQDVVLSADYMGITFTLNSADFNANYQLKSFVSILMIFIYLYYNYIFFNHLITLVEIGNFDDLIDLIGYDEFYDSNMM